MFYCCRQYFIVLFSYYHYSWLVLIHYIHFLIYLWCCFVFLFYCIFYDVGDSLLILSIFFLIWYCFSDHSIIVSSVDIGIIWFLYLAYVFILYLGQGLYLPLSLYLIWCLGGDVCEFNDFLSITYLDIFDFSVSIYV